MKKALLKTIYHLGGFSPFHRTTRDKVLILTYHRFGPEEDPFRVSRAEFAAHLEYLSRNNRVLPLGEAIDFLRNKKTLPPNTTVITIDDGYLDAYEIAFPLLKKFQMPATVYAVTDFLDQKCWLWTDLMRYVLLETENERVKIRFGEELLESEPAGETERIELAGRINSRLKKLPDAEKRAKIDEIAASLNVEIPAAPTADFAPFDWRAAREMDAENVFIESHTATHPILPNVSAADLDFELKTSKKRLEEVLERPVEHFCYPNGSFNQTIGRAAENAGYKSAVTTDYGFNETGSNSFALKRINAQSGIANFAQSASGFEALRQKITN